LVAWLRCSATAGCLPASGTSPSLVCRSAAPQYAVVTLGIDRATRLQQLLIICARCIGYSVFLPPSLPPSLPVSLPTSCERVMGSLQVRGCSYSTRIPLSQSLRYVSYELVYLQEKQWIHVFVS
jgi:hypothetical protein